MIGKYRLKLIFWLLRGKSAAFNMTVLAEDTTVYLRPSRLNDSLIEVTDGAKVGLDISDTGFYNSRNSVQAGTVRMVPKPDDHVPGRSAAHEAARKRGDKARAEINNKSARVKRPRKKE